MAQAARLNLRMQKEIKLLLNDPPPGVSLNISEDGSASSSLSSIEARIEGPDGTVYSKGVFILKIQIPERYPFQPPNVTFVTPIYHPNIDNGGRICLDILNLPPKGAWQPSINIATVLTSIGLLLSEPNPDDGLMAEISREYKYNRHVFDANARLWTEKYANIAAIGASGWGSVDIAALAKNTQMENIESLGSLPDSSNKDWEGNQKKRRLLGQKLSLKSERSQANTKTENQDPVPSHLPSSASSTYPTACFSDVSWKHNTISENMSFNDSDGVISKKECDENKKNLQLTGQVLSVTSVCEGSRKNLKLPGQRLSATSVASDQRSNGYEMLPSHLPALVPNSTDCTTKSSADIVENSLARNIGGSSDGLNKPLEGNRRIIRTLGLKLSLKSSKSERKRDDQKENMVPNHMPSHSSFNNVQKRPLEHVSSKNLCEATTLIPQNSDTKNQLPNFQLLSDEKCNQGRKKLCLPSKRLSLKSKLPETDSTCDKESNPPAYGQCDDRKQHNELPLSAPVLKSETMAPYELPLPAPVFKSQPIALYSAVLQEDINSSNHYKKSAAAVENMVVSDSEDSADECERPSRSSLSLMRRRLAGKLRN